MSERRSSEIGTPASAMPIADAAALPDAPLAMPVQSLEPPAPLALLRALFGASNRVVKH